MYSFRCAGLIFAGLLVLQGCAGAPYVDGRREAGKKITVGPSNEDVVAICHAGDQAPPEALKLAESECAKTGRNAQFTQKVKFACSMRASTRSFFRCTGTRTAP